MCLSWLRCPCLLYSSSSTILYVETLMTLNSWFEATTRFLACWSCIFNYCRKYRHQTLVKFKRGKLTDRKYNGQTKTDRKTMVRKTLYRMTEMIEQHNSYWIRNWITVHRNTHCLTRNNRRVAHATNMVISYERGKVRILLQQTVIWWLQLYH